MQATVAIMTTLPGATVCQPSLVCDTTCGRLQFPAGVLPSQVAAYKLAATANYWYLVSHSFFQRHLRYQSQHSEPSRRRVGQICLELSSKHLCTFEAWSSDLENGGQLDRNDCRR